MFNQKSTSQPMMLRADMQKKITDIPPPFRAAERNVKIAPLCAHDSVKRIKSMGGPQPRYVQRLSVQSAEKIWFKDCSYKFSYCPPARWGVVIKVCSHIKLKAGTIVC